MFKKIEIEQEHRIARNFELKSQQFLLILVKGKDEKSLVSYESKTKFFVSILFFLNSLSKQKD